MTENILKEKIDAKWLLFLHLYESAMHLLRGAVLPSPLATRLVKLLNVAMATNGLTRAQVMPDGNCMFHVLAMISVIVHGGRMWQRSLALRLQNQGPAYATVANSVAAALSAALRQLLAKWIRDPSDHELAESIARPGTFGEVRMQELAIQMICEQFPAVSHMWFGVLQEFAPGQYSVTPLSKGDVVDLSNVVLFYNNGVSMHFDAVVVKDTRTFDEGLVREMDQRASQAMEEQQRGFDLSARVAAELDAADRDAQHRQHAADEQATMALLASEGLGLPTNPHGWETFGGEPHVVSQSGGGGSDLLVAEKLREELRRAERRRQVEEDAKFAARLAAGE